MHRCVESSRRPGTEDTGTFFTYRGFDFLHTTSAWLLTYYSLLRIKSSPLIRTGRTEYSSYAIFFNLKVPINRHYDRTGMM